MLECRKAKLEGEVYKTAVKLELLNTTIKVECFLNAQTSVKSILPKFAKTTKKK